MTKPYAQGKQVLVFFESEVAQRKRVGPITQRSKDRNLSLLSNKLFFAICVRARNARGVLHRLEVHFVGGRMRI